MEYGRCEKQAATKDFFNEQQWAKVIDFLKYPHLNDAA
jgi:hypothetical protein